ncbi:MAG: hypothetical protein QOH89_110, partial [Pseudonocardiales bacterium]|nr:hypothetical protein [Pseudonocardiales bacterium]
REYTIEITRVHSAHNAMTVEYRIHNTGHSPIPEGFPIAIGYQEGAGLVGSSQVYMIEVPVAAGAFGDKHLTIEAENEHKDGDAGFLTMVGDQGGHSERQFNFNLAWSHDGTATATPH